MPLQEMMPSTIILESNINDVHIHIIVQITSTLSKMPNVFVPIVLEVYIKSIP